MTTHGDKQAERKEEKHRMGIKGLTRFLDENFDFHRVQLREFEALAVDGNNVCGYLYSEKLKLDWQMGGEYHKFSLQVTKFFEDIFHVGISRIIVVLDGLREIKKKKEVLKRRRDCNKTLEHMQNGHHPTYRPITPSLVLPTFALALLELKNKGYNIELHVSAGEGDCLTSSFSNSIPKCPVLAADSDYYMYELRNGYLPLKYFSPDSTCSLYTIDRLKDQYSWQDPNMRLIIPAKHGNDFICGSPDAKFFDTLSEIKPYKSPEDYLADHPPHLRAKFEESKKQYLDQIQLSPSELVRSSLKEFPFLVISEKEKVAFHFFLTRIAKNYDNILSEAVERIGGRSVWECSQYIRQFLYGFLKIPTVQEYIRHENSPEVVSNLVKSKDLIPQVDMNEISDMNASSRENLVLTVLRCKKLHSQYYKCLKSLPKELVLPVATAFYWHLSCDDIDDNLVWALLLCFARKGIPTEQHRYSNERDLSKVHAFSQWQSIYYDALSLNYLAGCPFPATNPAHLFSGEMSLAYAERVPRCLPLSISRDCLDKMFEIVTKVKKKPRGP